MTYMERMQAIVEEYRAFGEPWPGTARQIAEWAMGRGLWSPRRDLADLCADDIATAMREEFITDPQGRTVRAKHASRIKRDGTQPRMVWADIRTADRQHMEIAFQERRQQIVNDCRQLKTDLDSYNDNGNPGRPLQLVLDFTYDVEELMAA